MQDRLKQKPILSAQALDGLQDAKRQIMEAVTGKVPERLVLATAVAAVRLARWEAVPAEVLSARVLDLVRATLKASSQKSWKPDTGLLL